MKSFPVMWPSRRDEMAEYRRLRCPLSLPWHLVEPAREQAMRNHGQSLEHVAERGGLSPLELYGALHGWGLRELFRVGASKDEHIEYLRQLVEEDASPSGANS